MIERIFQDIPDGKLAEADHQSFLVNLGWSRGSAWGDLLQSKRILLISEAGSGKTYECQKQAQRLWDQGEPAFFIELAALASSDFRSLIDYDKKERFDTWLLSQSGVATFFLDSYDELKLTRGSFKRALNLLKEGIRGQLHRVRIVITTRPIPFDEQVVREILPVPAPISGSSKEEDFANIAMNSRPQKRFGEVEDEVSDWRVIALMPLSDQQIIEFARVQGVDEPDKLLEDLRKRNAQEFARRPQDLIEICLDWREYKRIRMHKDQVASNIRIKLQPREDRSEPAELSVDKAFDGASRLALAMLVMRRLTIRHSAEADGMDQEAALNPIIILSDWKPGERRALLERPLFGFASYGRVRFHHRSVLEYLASKRLENLLLQRGMTFRALKRLIFAETRGEIIVRPTMRPVAGWLAITESKVFEILRDNEPAVLLNEGDPEALTYSQRSKALYAYVKRHGRGGWRGLSVPHIQVHRFAFPELAGEINQLWEDGVENHEVREILLGLIELGQITDCADIAYNVAVDSEALVTERWYALDALIACADKRVGKIAAEFSSGSHSWQGSVARGAIARLFPQNISIEQFLLVLGWLEEEENSVTGFSWQLSQLITGGDFDRASLEELRDGLVSLVSVGLRQDAEWESISCDKSHLSSVLIAVCMHGLVLEASDEWLYASALALCLQRREDKNDTAPKRLREQLKVLSAEANERFFWVEDSLLQKFYPTTRPWYRFNKITKDGVVTLNIQRDIAWIKRSLGDVTSSFDDRAFLLEAAFYLLSEQSKTLEQATELKKLTRDQSDLVIEIDKWLRLRKLADWEKKEAKRQKQQEQKKAKNKASWIQFCREVTGSPEKMFSAEYSRNTAWNLFRVMRKKEDDELMSGWNRRFVEEQFGESIADRLRLALMDIWRQDKPTLPSERPENERNIYLDHWVMGLSAIYAEAEDSEWVIKLSSEEAELAARYIAIGSGRFPYWIESLIAVHPKAVDKILGEELSWELEQDTKSHGYSKLLQEISIAPETIAKFFLPRLRAWLNVNESVIGGEASSLKEIEHLRQVINTLLKYGTLGVQSHVLKIAGRRLDDDPPSELTFFWLPIIMKSSPQLGVEVLESQINNVDPSENSKAVKWFSLLFGRHSQQLNDMPFTPELLLWLLRIAYIHVRREDDVHSDGPLGVRDYAQDARRHILEAVYRLKGEAGWSIKQKLAEDPLFAHIKDRILAIAEENWAQEIDSEIFNEAQAVALDKMGEAPASTNNAMFSILKDRLSDLDDLLRSDASPWEAWSTINEEKIMRREIARELKHAANGLYVVDQEAVTADEKETDIRLRSTVSSHEAVIELKLADNRTIRDLRDTIQNQLVRKYMAPETSRAGCLLITVAKDRKWKNPDTGKFVRLPGLQTLLSDEAKRVEEAMGNSVSLAAHILDLRPRLPKER